MKFYTSDFLECDRNLLRLFVYISKIDFKIEINLASVHRVALKRQNLFFIECYSEC